MTIKYCDKCGKKHTELIQLREEYGDYELCDPCLKEIEEIGRKFRNDWLDEMSKQRIKLVQDWMGVKKEEKKPWLAKLFK